MLESILLRDATVQGIQLELIRRSRFNDFVGEKICASLTRHRELWKAVLLDRPGFANYQESPYLLIGGLIKLRDLSQNNWNADTLFVLTPTIAQARELAHVAEDGEWGGMSQVHENRREIDSALGIGRMEDGLLTIWWD